MNQPTFAPDDFSDAALRVRVPAGDLRAVSRLITLIENRVPRARALQTELFQYSGKAHVIGITGSPGAGKSTLVDQLANSWRALGKKVAILAIDPSSPFSGGAVLGDRIRMIHAAADPGVFIRSMATRGSLGGLSNATYDAIQVLDAAGFDIVLIETVGVGQAEVDIVRMAHTCVVVLVPGMGDSVQAFKAGILEIADLFVINKSDRDGADLLERDLLTLLSLVPGESEGWKTPVRRTVATTGDGTSAVMDSLTEHQSWLSSTAAGVIRRRTILEHTILRIARDGIMERVNLSLRNELTKLVDSCVARAQDPFTAAEALLKLATPR